MSHQNHVAITLILRAEPIHREPVVIDSDVIARDGWAVPTAVAMPDRAEDLRLQEAEIDALIARFSALVAR